MKNTIDLIDAILDAYDRQDFQPGPNGLTHCNEAVQAVCETLGYDKLAGLNADEICAFIAVSGDWSEVAFDNAQNMANQGSLLVAGLDSKALGQDHGHVVVIRPGKPCYSGKWGACPRVLNVGAENFIARAKRGPLTNQPSGLNEAFVPLPKIWVLRSTL